MSAVQWFSICCAAVSIVINIVTIRTLRRTAKAIPAIREAWYQEGATAMYREGEKRMTNAPFRHLTSLAHAQARAEVVSPEAVSPEAVTK
jgi:hypothetical protein